jgi:hypothetical protein
MGMARSLGDRLPDELVRALDDGVLDRHDQAAFLLVTTDDGGAPRLSMISAGELLVRDGRTLRLALWRGSRTARNLGRGGSALLGTVGPGSVTYVRADPVRLEVPEATGLECFELEVTGVEADAHAGMPVTSGIAFRIDEPGHAAAVAAWRRQRELLARAHVPSQGNGS